MLDKQLCMQHRNIIHKYIAGILYKTYIADL